MNYFLRLIPAFLLFFASGSPDLRAQAAASDEILLRIDAGRLGAMLDQASLLLKAKADDTDGAASDDIGADLQDTIKRYNVLLGIACDKDVVVGPPCGEIYAPQFPPPPLSSGQLRDEIDNATAHIYPFWSSICAKLDNPAHTTCQME